MKKTMMMAVTLAITVMAGVRAQDTITTGYRSFFGSESTEWYVGREKVDYLNRENVVFRVSGDTNVNGTGYKKINMGYRWSGDSPIVGDEFVGICREDTMTGRLWLWDKYYSWEEMLIADMSLEMGDDNVDTVYYDSLGRKVIVMSLPYYPEKYRVIEGVGPEYVDDDIISGGVFYLVCAYHNGVRLPFESQALDWMYSGNPSRLDYDKCWIVPVTGVAMVDSENVVVYPNPCVATVSMELPEEAQVTVFDALGHVQRSKRYDAGMVTVDMSALPVGIYFISTAYTDRTHWGKIIKQ